MKAIVTKSRLCGTAMVPGSKSHTIRSVILAVMAEGESIIHNPLTSLDGKSALAAAAMFGAETKDLGDTWVIQGTAGKPSVPYNYVDCGNSGSVAYFAAPLAALCDGYTYLTGDAQIRRRPIDEVVHAINELGGTAEHAIPGTSSCPIVIKGKMKGGAAHFSGKLSQFVSGILMAAPLLENDTEILIKDPKEIPYLQITNDWLYKFGAEYECADDYTAYKVKGRQKYIALETTIASDWSAVAFPLVAAIITGSELVIEGVDFNDTQGDKHVVDELLRMGASLEKDVEGHCLIVHEGNTLVSDITIDLKNIPDSLPAMCIAASYAKGNTVFTGLEAVRLKETDRVAVMCEELAKVGVRAECTEDTMTVYGGSLIHGALTDSHDDHRVAMAMMICGLGCEGEMEVHGAECAAVSFPNFFEVMRKIGMNCTLSA